MRASRARAGSSRRSTSAASISPVFRAAPGAQAGAGSSSWGSFKDIFSGIFSGRAAAAAAARSAAGHRSRVPGHGRLLDGDSRRPGAHPDQPPGDVPHLPRPGAHRRRDAVPGVQRHRPGDADGRADEVQHHLPALQRDGTHLERLPHLPRRGHGDAHRDGRVPHQAGHARRPAHPAAGQGQRRHQRRRGGRPVSDRAHRHASGVYARRATTFSSPCR